MGVGCRSAPAAWSTRSTRTSLPAVTLTEVSLDVIHSRSARYIGIVAKCIGAPSSTQIAAASTKLAVLQATLPTPREELGSMYLVRRRPGNGGRAAYFGVSGHEDGPPAAHCVTSPELCARRRVHGAQRHLLNRSNENR